MNIATLRVFRYDLALREPLRLRDHVLNRRTGLVLRIESETGETGHGEAAPLPGFSRQDLDTVTRQALVLTEALEGEAIPVSSDLSGGEWTAWLGQHELAPSLRFALDSAILGVLAAARGVPLATVLSTTARGEVSVNGLIAGAHETAVTRAADLRQSGYKAVKLKVGRESSQADIECVRAVREALGADVALRLDANRAWKLVEAVAFGKAVADCAIEYIEEPVDDPQKLPDFHAATDLPYALDETILGENDPALDEVFSRAKALILKPTLLGGIARTIQLSRHWEARAGTLGVISSSFESGLGIATLAQIAAGLNREDVPAGLDTLSYFAEDVLDTQVPLRSGRLNIEDAVAAAQTLRMDRLHEVRHD